MKAEWKICNAAVRLAVLRTVALSLVAVQCLAATGDFRQSLSACDRPGNLRFATIQEDALCGSLTVAEDPAKPDGRQIDIAVMLLPAIAEVPEPDPVFYLAGGPGQSAIETGPAIIAGLPEIRNTRDVVLVDQRGTGSSGNIACSNEAPEQRMLSPDAMAEKGLVEMAECLKTLPADPAMYTTHIAMDDLDAVREALGYQQINLFGISYGTRAALVYARQHGSHVRSMILDGVAPPDISILGQFPVDTEAALQKLFDDCEAATPCHQAFPDLVAEFATLQSRLRASPGLVPFRDPATGELQSHYMDDEILRGVTRQVLYHRTLSVLLPLAFHKAHEGDFQPLLTLGYQFGGGSSGISAGMMASVFCAEDISRLTGEEPEGRFYRHADNGMLMRVCEFWPTGEVPDSYFEPVESSVPTVLLSGELDPVTPPKYGEHAHQTLHQSVHIVVPGVGHNASFTGCLPDVLYGFLGDLQTGKVDSGCTEHLKRPAFFTTPAGPVPLFDTASEPVANQSEPLQEVTDGGQGQ